MNDCTSIYYHPHFRTTSDKFWCDHYQWIKIPSHGLGLLLEHDLSDIPWFDIAINLILQWSAKQNVSIVTYCALTCIYTTTNLVNLVHTDSKVSELVTYKFEQLWLAWYPRPRQVFDSNGEKFEGYFFTHIFQNFEIKHFWAVE